MTLIELAQKLRPIIEQAMESVDDRTASEVATLFPHLKSDGSLISGGTRINWRGRIKRAAAALWDTVENDPDHAPTLWEDIDYWEGHRIIPAVITSTAAFDKGELGWWGDVLYESLYDANVYTPDAWPEGWKISENSTV